MIITTDDWIECNLNKKKLKLRSLAKISSVLAVDFILFEYRLYLYSGAIQFV